MDDFRTLRQLIVGWLLLLVALIPMNAQNGNCLLYTSDAADE